MGEGHLRQQLEEREGYIGTQGGKKKACLGARKEKKRGDIKTPRAVREKKARNCREGLLYSSGQQGKKRGRLRAVGGEKGKCRENRLACSEKKRGGPVSPAVCR